MEKTFIPPVQLWVGNKDIVQQHTKLYLQTKFCTGEQAPCLQCVACQQIADNRHHAIYWLRPEKNQYTRSQLEIITQTVVTALGQNELRFFVLEYADLLSPACANSLLKIFEEPAVGNYFILLTERRDMVLPTLISRAVEQRFFGEHTLQLSSLITLLHNPQLNQLVAFSQAYEACNLTDYELIALLDELVSFWTQAARRNDADLYSRDYALIVLDAYSQLPMPGSMKLFWRNIYLQLALRSTY